MKGKELHRRTLEEKGIARSIISVCRSLANITTVRAVLIIRISEVSAQYDASKENTIVFAMTAVDGNLIIPEVRK